MYHGAAKIVKPKMDALKVAEAQLAKATAQLEAAEAELNKVLSEARDEVFPQQRQLLSRPGG